MQKFIKQFALILYLLFLPLLVLAKDLIVMGGSFDPPTSSHIEMIKKLSSKPDTDVVVMVNTAGSKQFHLSALERARLVAAGLAGDANESRVRIVLQAYSELGAIPVSLKAFSQTEYTNVYYSIGADVHNAWKGNLPQIGHRLEPARDIRYLIFPRINPQTGQPEKIELKNPKLEEVLEDIEETATSSTQVRNFLKEISIDEESNLESLRDVSNGVRELLAQEHLLRKRSLDESAFFEELYYTRFLEIRNKLAKAFPEYKEVISSSHFPLFDSTASLLAWDEAIVRKIVDTVVAHEKLNAYSIKNFPTNGEFADSLLFYKLIDVIHPEYLELSPHKNQHVLGEATQLKKFTELAQPNRTSENLTTTQLHQLPSGVFDKQRRELHKKILSDFEQSYDLSEKMQDPRIIFLAGAPGAGKTKVLEKIQESNALRLPILDMDRFRSALIKADSSLQEITDFDQVAAKTNSESAYLQGILWSKFVREGKSFIVDGTFSATEYFEGVIARSKQKGYKISIIYVTAPEDQLLGRIEERAKREGRGVPKWKVEAALKGSEKSWQKLSQLADTAIRINNPNSEHGVNTAEVVQALGLGKEETNKLNLLNCGKWLVHQ